MSFKTVLARATLLSTLLSACSPGSDEPVVLSPVGGRATALEAYCSVEVQGVGPVDLESDYLPHVVACENGAASFEALRAQAVAARSYVYYRLSTGDGTITDGQGDQVYTCAQAPTQRHYDAVASTAGEVLQYQGTLVAAFYVAGAIPSSGSCEPSPADEDRFATERYVTYNWERAGAGVEQSSLGFLHPENHANRGCHSQNGAHCLAEAGWSYEDILRYYYGADIDHVIAAGSCVEPPSLPHGCGQVVDDQPTLFDESGPCFLRGCAEEGRFEVSDVGEGGASLLVTGNPGSEPDCFGRWRLSFTRAGPHRLEVHLPGETPRVGEVTYLVRHGAYESAVILDQSHGSGFVSLGVFEFSAGSFQYVELSDLAAEAGSSDNGPYVTFDAVRVTPMTAAAVEEPAGGPQREDAGGTPSAENDEDETGESHALARSRSDDDAEPFTCDCTGPTPTTQPLWSMPALALVVVIARRRTLRPPARLSSELR